MHLPLCVAAVVVGAQLCVVAEQAALGGSQEVMAWSGWGEADVQWRGVALQRQQLTEHRANVHGVKVKNNNENKPSAVSYYIIATQMVNEP